MAVLSEDPEARVESLAELVGIACEIEAEAVRRYRWLCEQMTRRGETATAEAFARLAAEEESHGGAVERWAEGLGEPLPEAGAFSWRLPEDLARSWDEVADSSLLTPYRAYAIAVDNEQRAFALYAYIAARAEDPRIAQEAEQLAREELRHAALLRTWRRAAWRAERPDDDMPSPRAPVDSLARLEALISDCEAAIALRHRAAARRLEAAGDLVSAGLLSGGAQLLTEHPEEEGPTRVSLRLLTEAQRPLERYAELLEAVLVAPADDAVQDRAQSALADTVGRIARIGRRIEVIATA